MTRRDHEHKGVVIFPLSRVINFEAWMMGHRWGFINDKGRIQNAPTLQGAQWLIDRQTESTKGVACNSQ
jgi:hypothetical protein